MIFIVFSQVFLAKKPSILKGSYKKNYPFFKFFFIKKLQIVPNLKKQFFIKNEILLKKL